MLMKQRFALAELIEAIDAKALAITERPTPETTNKLAMDIHKAVWELASVLLADKVLFVGDFATHVSEGQVPVVGEGCEGKGEGT